MKYVFNKGRYAVAFEATIKGRVKKITFDRRRIYLDTGNIATTGVTDVEDEVYAALLENKRFTELIDSGELMLTSAPKLDASEAELSELKAENAKLKKELEQSKKPAKKSADKETEKQLKAKDDEITTLKAKLEALTKQQDETEGF